VLNNAKSYIGTREGDQKHKAIVDNYNAIKPLPVGYKVKMTDEWCAAFVTVMGDISGASFYIGRECGVHRFVQIFKNKGIWRGLEKPSPGDIIVFDWQKNGWKDHIGFVEKIENSKVTTIEGNTSGRVARRKYAWNDWRVAGYARPQYPILNKGNKSIHDLAREVIQKKWGNGKERKQRLIAAGYNYDAVQKEVNKLMNKKLKTNETVAREVIDKKWGNGEARKKRLANAGYNYDAVQKIVNQLMKAKSNKTIAKEVIAKKWGNGEARKQRLTDAGYDYEAIQKIVNQLM